MRLERSATNKVVAGVCGGLGDYLQVDPTMVRAFFVIAGILTAGAFILVYIVLLVLMPLPGARPPIDDLLGRSGPGSAAPPPSGVPEEAPRPPTADDGRADRSRQTFGYVLIAIGLVFLLANLGAFRLVQWSYVWPLVLVALGLYLLLQRTRR